MKTKENTLKVIGIAVFNPDGTPKGAFEIAKEIEEKIKTNEKGDVKMERDVAGNLTTNESCMYTGPDQAKQSNENKQKELVEIENIIKELNNVRNHIGISFSIGSKDRQRLIDGLTISIEKLKVIEKEHNDLIDLAEELYENGNSQEDDHLTILDYQIDAMLGIIDETSLQALPAKEKAVTITTLSREIRECIYLKNNIEISNRAV